MFIPRFILPRHLLDLEQICDSYLHQEVQQGMSWASGHWRGGRRGRVWLKTGPRGSVTGEW